ncbi:MAG: DUF4158 domain-containing protein [Proteobacteria bacterium]|nr:DUF4158 domain-containing protein [Pseudomonadota bacterium]
MNNKRLKILSNSEINELYELPQFSHSEQESYFSLSKKEYKTMTSRGSLASKVHFILQLGYFKAASQFFNCRFSEVKKDIDYILQEHFNDAKLNIKNISKETRQSNQKLIAELLGYKINKTKIKRKLSEFLRVKIQFQNNPIYLFQEILSYLDQNKLMLLGYSTLQDLIGDAISKEENRLGMLLEKYFMKENWEIINGMLKMEKGQYVLTALAKDPKSFRHNQITGEVKKLHDHQRFYQISKKILPKLKLSNQNISYYASLAIHCVKPPQAHPIKSRDQSYARRHKFPGRFVA